MRIEYTIKFKANSFVVMYADTVSINDGIAEVTYKISESYRFEDYAKKSELEGLMKSTKGEYLLETIYCPKKGYIGAWMETRKGWDMNE